MRGVAPLVFSDAKGTQTTVTLLVDMNTASEHGHGRDKFVFLYAKLFAPYAILRVMQGVFEAYAWSAVGSSLTVGAPC